MSEQRDINQLLADINTIAPEGIEYDASESRATRGLRLERIQDGTITRICGARPPAQFAAMLEGFLAALQENKG